MSKKINKFLDNYIKDTVYDYAVMIDGEWGTGKKFNVQIEKVELSSFDLIKVKNWNMLKNDVKFKISRL